MFKLIKKLIKPSNSNQHQDLRRQRLLQKESDEVDWFLPKIEGVIHVGANSGQERYVYDKYNLNVVWVEAIPEVFNLLETNIKDLPKQKAYEALLTDVVGKEFEFNVSSNNGSSSSIFDFKDHKIVWPNVDYIRKELIFSTTFDEMVSSKKLDMSAYQGLILDTQGSELLVLKGAVNQLQNFKFVKVEASDFEAYASGCLVDEIEAFMNENGFKEISRLCFSESDNVGRCFDILYTRD